MLEESKEMKMIRDVRDKHYEETKGMNSKQLLDFYRQRAKRIDSKSTESQKTNDKSFPSKYVPHTRRNNSNCVPHESAITRQELSREFAPCCIRGEGRPSESPCRWGFLFGGTRRSAE